MKIKPFLVATTLVLTSSFGVIYDLIISAQPALASNVCGFQEPEITFETNNYLLHICREENEPFLIARERANLDQILIRVFATRDSQGTYTAVDGSNYYTVNNRSFDVWQNSRRISSQPVVGIYSRDRRWVSPPQTQNFSSVGGTEICQARLTANNPGSRIRVRSGAGTNNTIVGHGISGENVFLYSRNGRTQRQTDLSGSQWYRISLANRGVDGWVREDFLFNFSC